MVTFHIISLFPESFSHLDYSIVGRAQKNKKIKIKIYNPRDFTKDKHKTTDDRPYGGGPGMVMKAEPIISAIKKAVGKRKAKIILLDARGKLLSNSYAEGILRRHKNIVLIAGHYEGIDERVSKILKAEKISIGPYVLTGGELPAMVFIDVITRRIPGVLGKYESLEEGRIASGSVYTRPEVFTYKKKKYRVTKVLLSGHHKKIEEWRKKK